MWPSSSHRNTSPAVGWLLPTHTPWEEIQFKKISLISIALEKEQNELKPQTHKSSYEKLWNHIPMVFGQLSNREIIMPQIKQRAIVTWIFTVSHHKVI